LLKDLLFFVWLMGGIAAPFGIKGKGAERKETIAYHRGALYNE
jgi:hypothetical protein